MAAVHIVEWIHETDDYFAARGILGVYGEKKRANSAKARFAKKHRRHRAAFNDWLENPKGRDCPLPPAEPYGWPPATVTLIVTSHKVR